MRVAGGICGICKKCVDFLEFAGFVEFVGFAENLLDYETELTFTSSLHPLNKSMNGVQKGAGNASLRHVDLALRAQRDRLALACLSGQGSALGGMRKLGRTG